MGIVLIAKPLTGSRTLPLTLLTVWIMSGSNFPLGS